jgi:DNA-directed RNA polymerase subunit RPC12/RpoP
MSALGLPLCPLTDLPRVMCGCPQHSDSFTMTDTERKFVAGGWFEAETPTPPPTARTLDSYLARSWAVGDDPLKDVGRCDHGKPEGVYLCAACEMTLFRLLHDVPALVVDLEVTLTRQDVFVDSDTLVGSSEESPLPWREAASQAIRRMFHALGGRPAPAAHDYLLHWAELRRDARVAEVYGRLADAVTFARSVIERREAKVYYGQCPNCSNPIRQDRIKPDEPNPTVQCPCGYRAALARHQAAQLDLAEGSELTEAELLRVLNDGGETVARHELSNVLYRHDEGVIPRARVNRPRWRDGKLVPHEAWVYRLGHVRSALLAKRVRRRG